MQILGCFFKLKVSLQGEKTQGDAVSGSIRVRSQTLPPRLGVPASNAQWGELRGGGRGAGLFKEVRSPGRTIACPGTQASPPAISSLFNEPLMGFNGGEAGEDACVPEHFCAANKVQLFFKYANEY